MKRTTKAVLRLAILYTVVYQAIVLFVVWAPTRTPAEGWGESLHATWDYTRFMYFPVGSEWNAAIAVVSLLAALLLLGGWHLFLAWRSRGDNLSPQPVVK